MNKNHGYGGSFNHETAEDKCIVELATAKQWRKAIKAVLGLRVGWPEHNPNDPPDCFVDFEGRRIGVELVKLIAQKHLERAALGENPYHGQLFLDMQWSRERFAMELNQTLQSKGLKYAAKKLQIDILVICAAEPWLTSNQARQWLAEIVVTSHQAISNAFLLFDYEPGYHDPGNDTSRHWPVLLLYGDMFGSAGDQPA
jgi:hypothetical protein